MGVANFIPARLPIRQLKNQIYVIGVRSVNVEPFDCCLDDGASLVIFIFIIGDIFGKLPALEPIG